MIKKKVEDSGKEGNVIKSIELGGQRDSSYEPAEGIAMVEEEENFETVPTKIVLRACVCI